MKVYIGLLAIKLKEVVEYRVSFINDTFIQFFAYMVTFINITLLLNQINNLDGWSYKEILLLWILNVFSYGFSGMFVYTGCKQLENHIQKGTFDYFLTKPLNTFWYYMMKNINTTFIFHICFSSIILIWLLMSLEVQFSIKMVLGIITFLICAICIQSCIMILFAVPAFWIIKSNSLVNTAIYGLRNFNTYPISIYDKCVRGILTFIIPYAFVSYYPAVFILGKNSSSMDNLLLLAEPLVAAFVLLLSIWLWKTGIKRYSSTGN